MPASTVSSTQAPGFSDPRGGRLSAAVVELRFAPKAWAWPEQGQTLKWIVGEASGIVETRALFLATTLDETCRARAKQLVRGLERPYLGPSRFWFAAVASSSP